MYKNIFKRFFDFCISLVALIIISPILLVITIWLHFANKGAGAFFFQERPGKDGKIFRVIKFKTMTDERDAEGKLLPDSDRLTKVGKGVKTEGELVVSGTTGYIYVPAPWWKMDYFEIRREDPTQNKRYFYQLDGEGIRYEMVSFLKAINNKKFMSYIDQIISKAIVRIVHAYKEGDFVSI